jgi:hypothetical protein
MTKRATIWQYLKSRSYIEALYCGSKFNPVYVYGFVAAACQRSAGLELETAKVY